MILPESVFLLFTFVFEWLASFCAVRAAAVKVVPSLTQELIVSAPSANSKDPTVDKQSRGVTVESTFLVFHAFTLS